MKQNENSSQKNLYGTLKLNKGVVFTMKEHQIRLFWILMVFAVLMVTPSIMLARSTESPAPVELSNPNKSLQVFKPSTQVNYDETVVIHAPPPEQEAPKSIPVKRFGWLNIESKPLNPTQQNR